MIVRKGYELIETPPADEPLMVGDCLEFTWDIYQSGAYYWSVMASRLEQACESDGRFRLVRYDYRWDEGAKTISYEIQVLSNNVAQTDVPAFVTSLGTVGVIVLVCITLLLTLFHDEIQGLYPGTARVIVARYKRVKEIVDSDLPPAEKVEKIKEITDAPVIETGKGVFESVGDITGNMLLIALVVLAVVVLGSMKGILK